jgi:hypothetical protein
MKISFPNCGSGAGISIRPVINALLNWHKAERAQTAQRKKNMPQITSEWNYRPRQVIRRYAAIDSAGAKTSVVMIPEPSPTNQENDIWFSFVSLDPAVEDARGKAPWLGPEPVATNNNVWCTKESYINA